MQNLLKLHLILFSVLVFLLGCSSSELSEKEEKVSEENIVLSTAEGDYINIRSSNNGSKNNYSKNILIPLERIDGCDYVVQGKIEYIKDGAVLATVDFGDGECDDIATKTVDSKSSTFNLRGKKKSSRYKRSIIKPLVKIDGCDYTVEGKIEYIKDGVVVATVDFGDGECDNIATKTVDGVDREIKLNKKGKKPKKQVVFKLILQIFIFKNSQEYFFYYSLPNQRRDIKKLIMF